MKWFSQFVMTVVSVVLQLLYSNGQDRSNSTTRQSGTLLTSQYDIYVMGSTAAEIQFSEIYELHVLHSNLTPYWSGFVSCWQIPLGTYISTNFLWSERPFPHLKQASPIVPPSRPHNNNTTASTSTKLTWGIPVLSLFVSSACWTVPTENCLLWVTVSVTSRTICSMCP